MISDWSYAQILTTNSVLPVIAGMAVGIGLIAVMIIVGNNLPQDGRRFYGSSANDNEMYRSLLDDENIGGVTTSINLNDGEFFTSGPGDIVVIVDPDEEDVDGCCDDVATIEFSHELMLPLTDKD